MSDELAAAKAIFEGDATMLATATGGVWDWTELGRRGLNRTDHAGTAFDANGLIKPLVVLKLRTAVPIEGISDDAAQVVAQRSMLEAWYYEDAGYSNINIMRARGFVLLHGKQLGGFVCRWAFDGPQLRDMDLDACMQRVDYASVSLK